MHHIAQKELAMLPLLLLASFSLTGLIPEAYHQQPGTQSHPAWLHELDKDQHEAEDLLHLPPCSNGILQAPLPPLVPQAWQAHKEAINRRGQANFQDLSDAYEQAAASQPGRHERSQSVIFQAGQDELGQATSAQSHFDSSSASRHVPLPLPQSATGHGFDPANTRSRKYYPTGPQLDADMVLRATCLARFHPWPRASPR